MPIARPIKTLLRKGSLMKDGTDKIEDSNTVTTTPAEIINIPNPAASIKYSCQ
jgi:hypothetical protein